MIFFLQVQNSNTAMKIPIQIQMPQLIASSDMGTRINLASHMPIE